MAGLLHLAAGQHINHRPLSLSMSDSKLSSKSIYASTHLFACTHICDCVLTQCKDFMDSILKKKLRGDRSVSRTGSQYSGALSMVALVFPGRSYLRNTAIYVCGVKVQ